jgi:hypothetical protein
MRRVTELIFVLEVVQCGISCITSYVFSVLWLFFWLTLAIITHDLSKP